MQLQIQLDWSYLKTEIDYETYKAAEISIAENPTAKEEAQSDNTTADAEFCRSKITAAIGNLEEIMHRHFLLTASRSATNALSKDQSSWVMNLEYADDSRRSINIKSLTTKCHRYVVAYVLAEWCKLALPQLVQSYTDRMELEKTAIDSLVNRKEAPSLFLDDTDTAINTNVDGITATVAVQSVEYGTAPSATVNVTRTESDDKVVHCFNFTFKIPKGAPGETGAQGVQGITGAQGIQGSTGVVDYTRIDNYINQQIAAALASNS